MTVVEPNRQINYGIAILRVLSCFGVILCHFFLADDITPLIKPFIAFRSCAVPVFMLLAFYYSAGLFFSRNKVKLGKRFNRLFFPHVLWAVIYYLVFSLADFVFGIGYVDGISDLFYQILSGHTLNVSMWFQSVLIIITLFIFAIFCLCRNNSCLLVVLVVLFAGCFISQYTGFNYNLFSSLPDAFMNPAGRICEMIPYALTGLFFAKTEIPAKLKNKCDKAKWGILSGLAAVMVFYFFYGDLFDTEGFVYSGVSMYYVTIAIFLFFYLLPLSAISERTETILQKMTGFTFGIYCIHKMIGFLFLFIRKKLSFSFNSFFYCVIIYVLSYAVCFVISIVPIKHSKKLVA